MVGERKKFKIKVTFSNKINKTVGRATEKRQFFFFPPTHTHKNPKKMYIVRFLFVSDEEEVEKKKNTDSTLGMQGFLRLQLAPDLY